MPFLCLLCAVCTLPLRADYIEAMGYPALQAEVGAALTDGSGVQVTQVEADEDPDDPSSTSYLPFTGVDAFAGKSFTDKSGLHNQGSSHATGVGRVLYGLDGIAPGITQIDNYLAVEDKSPLSSSDGGWILQDALRLFTVFQPRAETSAIQNHSYIVLYENTSLDELVRRTDFQAARDGVFVCAGVNNGSSSQLTAGLGGLYNGLAVGRGDGNHAHGLLTVEGDTRVKPDLVVLEASTTSNATPAVGAAAAVLLQKARETPSLELTAGTAQRPETLRAILLASARKDALPAWTPLAGYPYDATYGAGALSLYHAWQVLCAGEQPASGPGSPLWGSPQGWTAGSLGSGAVRWYFFEVPVGQTFGSFTAALPFNRNITTTGGLWQNVQVRLPNLDLALHAVNALGQPTGLLATSATPGGQAEHLYLPGGLLPGRYALQVTRQSGGGSTAADFALAWTLEELPLAYADWELTELAPKVAPGLLGELSDADFDGAGNFLEFAFGTDPCTPDRALGPRVEEEDGEWLLVYTRRTDAALTYTREVLTTAGAWITPPETDWETVRTTPSPDGTTEEVALRYLGGDGTRLLARITVSD